MLVILRYYHFETAEQAAVFLGVVPVEKNSGTSIRGQGDPEIRAKLNRASLCDMRFNPAMMAMCAIGALMRKLAHWYL